MTSVVTTLGGWDDPTVSPADSRQRRCCPITWPVATATNRQRGLTAVALVIEKTNG